MSTSQPKASPETVVLGVASALSHIDWHPERALSTEDLTDADERLKYIASGVTPSAFDQDAWLTTLQCVVDFVISVSYTLYMMFRIYRARDQSLPSTLSERSD